MRDEKYESTFQADKINLHKGQHSIFNRLHLLFAIDF